MRRARDKMRESGGRCQSVRLGRSTAVATIALALVCATVFALPACAQDSATISRETASPPTSFTTRTVPGTGAQSDTAQPLYLQGDELIYDSKGDRITARGNVEIFYNDYVLTADEVIYDQSANTLTAVGNVTLRDPNGAITRSERITLTDDFREGFIQSLSIVAKDESRITARRAIRRDGNVTEFENGKFTPCKPRGWQAAALVCRSKSRHPR